MCIFSAATHLCQLVATVEHLHHMMQYYSCLLYYSRVNDWVADADTRQVDAGNYTCELRGPLSQVLRQLTHYLLVRGNGHLLCYTFCNLCK